jgi:hypothetical protein
VLAALVTAPACWAIFGAGIPDSCALLGGDDAACMLQSALDNPARIDRLNALFRLDARIGADAQALAEQWRLLEQAAKSYIKAAEDAAKKLDALKDVKPPSFEGLKLEDPGAAGEAVKAYMAGIGNALELQAHRQHAGAALLLAERALGLGRLGIAWMREGRCQDVSPGFFGIKPFGAECAPVDAIDLRLDKTSRRLDQTWAGIEKLIAALRASASLDWAGVSAEVLAVLRVQLDTIDEPERAITNTDWDRLTGRLAQRAGVIVPSCARRTARKWRARSKPLQHLPAGGDRKAVPTRRHSRSCPMPGCSAVWSGERVPMEPCSRTSRGPMGRYRRCRCLSGSRSCGGSSAGCRRSACSSR